jgi:DegV family protein with EDD domain
VTEAHQATVGSTPGPTSGSNGDHHATKNRVGIVTDSSCDLPDDLVARLGIEIAPLSIRFGDEEFADREQLSTDEFWARCAQSSVLPSTAAPSPGRFEQSYRALAARGSTNIIAITISGALSATFQSAELAAKNVAADGINVVVIDSRTVTLGLGTIVLACAGAAAERSGDDDALASLVDLATDLIARTRVFGALDTMENLKKGGRVGNAKALLATALSIKPIIAIENGVVEQYGKQRTRSKATAFLVEKVAAAKGRMEHLAVLHADCSDVDEFVAKLRPYFDGEIVVGQIGPVVGAHAGRGTIGVAYQETS